MTQACDYKIKEINIPDTKAIVELHIVDVAGQKIFNSIAIDLITDVTMCVLVYDVNNVDTFQSLSSWYDGIRDQNGRDVPGIIIGNKTDLNRQQVSSDDAKGLADSMGLGFYEISATIGQEVEGPFKDLAKNYHQQYEDRIARLK